MRNTTLKALACIFLLIPSLAFSMDSLKPYLNKEHRHGDLNCTFTLESDSKSIRHGHNKGDIFCNEATAVPEINGEGTILAIALLGGLIAARRERGKKK